MVDSYTDKDLVAVSSVWKTERLLVGREKQDFELQLWKINLLSMYKFMQGTKDVFFDIIRLLMIRINVSVLLAKL